MRPLQIKTLRTDTNRKSEPTIQTKNCFRMTGEIELTEDYTDFFSRIGQFGNLEEAFHESMSRWFKKHEVVDYGSAIMADEEAVFVRVIYRPETRFAYFLFKPTYQHLQGDLRRHLESDLDDLLDERVLVVSARNESQHWRIEQWPEGLSRALRINWRGYGSKEVGIPGALLQNPFMGDILSSVEYVAHKNRPRIDSMVFGG